MNRMKASIVSFVAFLSLVGAILAVAVLTQTNPVTWTYTNKSFTVYTNAELTNPLSDGQAIDFGIVAVGTFINTTYVENNGNVPIIINVAITKGEMPIGYDLTVAFPDGQTIPVGAYVQAVFTLTIPADPEWLPTGVSVTWSSS